MEVPVSRYNGSNGRKVSIVVGFGNFDDALETRDGGLAQLVERLLCMQKVRGSIPLTSIHFYPLVLMNV
eukprot:scaffold873_cov257-Chaetoceros_neogracile.AAC.3